MRRRWKLILAAVLQPVADLQHHAAVTQVTRLDPDDHGLAALGYAVFDRILDDRLKDQRRKPRGFQRLRNFNLDVKTVREARFLDVEIEALQIDFLSERNVRARIE